MGAVGQGGGVPPLVGDRRHIGHPRERDLGVVTDEDEVLHCGGEQVVQQIADRRDHRVGALWSAGIDVEVEVGVGDRRVAVDADHLALDAVDARRGDRVEPGHDLVGVDRAEVVAQAFGGDEEQRIGVGVQRGRRRAMRDGRALPVVRRWHDHARCRRRCRHGLQPEEVRVVAVCAVVPADLHHHLTAHTRRWQVEPFGAGAAAPADREDLPFGERDVTGRLRVDLGLWGQQVRLLPLDGDDRGLRFLAQRAGRGPVDDHVVVGGQMVQRHAEPGVLWDVDGEQVDVVRRLDDGGEPNAVARRGGIGDGVVGLEGVEQLQVEGGDAVLVGVGPHVDRAGGNRRPLGMTRDHVHGQGVGGRKRLESGVAVVRQRAGLAVEGVADRPVVGLDRVHRNWCARAGLQGGGAVDEGVAGRCLHRHGERRRAEQSLHRVAGRHGARDGAVGQLDHVGGIQVDVLPRVGRPGSQSEQQVGQRDVGQRAGGHGQQDLQQLGVVVSTELAEDHLGDVEGVALVAKQEPAVLKLLDKVFRWDPQQVGEMEVGQGRVADVGHLGVWVEVPIVGELAQRQGEVEVGAVQLAAIHDVGGHGDRRKGDGGQGAGGERGGLQVDRGQRDRGDVGDRGGDGRKRDRGEWDGGEWDRGKGGGLQVDRGQWDGGQGGSGDLDGRQRDRGQRGLGQVDRRQGDRRQGDGREGDPRKGQGRQGDVLGAGLVRGIDPELAARVPGSGQRGTPLGQGVGAGRGTVELDGGQRDSAEGDRGQGDGGQRRSGEVDLGDGQRVEARLDRRVGQGIAEREVLRRDGLQVGPGQQRFPAAVDDEVGQQDRRQRARGEVDGRQRDGRQGDGREGGGLWVADDLPQRCGHDGGIRAIVADLLGWHVVKVEGAAQLTAAEGEALGLDRDLGMFDRPDVAAAVDRGRRAHLIGRRTGVHRVECRRVQQRRQERGRVVAVERVAAEVRRWWVGRAHVRAEQRVSRRDVVRLADAALAEQVRAGPDPGVRCRHAIGVPRVGGVPADDGAGDLHAPTGCHEDPAALGGGVVRRDCHVEAREDPVGHVDPAAPVSGVQRDGGQ